MSKYLKLTKALFLTGFAVNKKKNNQKSTFKTLLIFAIIFTVMSFIYNFTYISSLHEMGISYESYLIIVLAIGSLLNFVISFTQMQNTIFKTKDYEFLESLPLKKSTIVAAKITAVYLTNFAEDIIIVLPATIYYVIFTNNVLPAILTIISSIFVAVIPLLVTSLIGSVIALATSRMKHREVFTVVFYILFFVGVFAFSFVIGSGSQMGMDISSVTKPLPYLKLLEWSFEPSKFYFFFVFLALHIILAIAVIFFISKIYRPINNYLNNYRLHESYVVGKDTTSMSQQSAIRKKEHNMLFKNSQYLVNSFLGSFMFLLIGIIYIFIGNMTDDGTMTIEEIEEMRMIMIAMIPAFGMLMTSMMTSSSGSISLEGKNFEMLGSYPISPMSIIKEKLRLAIIVPIVLDLFSATILTIVLIAVQSFNLGVVIAIYILPLLGSILIAHVGMLCGLRWAKFDFENEMQVLKNCSAINFTMLFVTLPTFVIAMVSMGVNIAMYYVFGSYGTLFGLIIPIIAYAIAIPIVRSALKRKGEMLFKRALTR